VNRGGGWGGRMVGYQNPREKETETLQYVGKESVESGISKVTGSRTLNKILQSFILSILR